VWQPPSVAPPSVSVVNLGDWPSIPAEMKVRILEAERWVARLSLMEGMVRGLRAQLGQCGFGGDRLVAMGKFLDDIEASVRARHDQAVGAR